MSQQVQPFVTWDNLTSTSSGTGTTTTTINGGSAYQLPTTARTILEMLPYQAPIAAITAAESSLQRLELTSTDLNPNIGPKKFVLSPIMAGLGVSPFAIAPILRPIPLNITGTGGQRMTATATALVANTAAYRVGSGLKLTNAPPTDPQLFMDDGGRTSTGTAATRVIGTAITVQGGSRLVKAYGRAAVGGTVTASESIVGYIEMISNGFQTNVPLNFPVQPVVTALGTAIGMGIPGENEQNVSIPLNSSGTGQISITPYFNMEEAQTAAQSFVPGIMYIK